MSVLPHEVLFLKNFRVIEAHILLHLNILLTSLQNIQSDAKMQEFIKDEQFSIFFHLTGLFLSSASAFTTELSLYQQRLLYTTKDSSNTSQIYQKCQISPNVSLYVIK